MNAVFASPDPIAPLFAQVRDALRSEILNGKLPPGAKLPPEAELIARFGVSRITVRQALSELQAAGLVTTVNGKGSYVTKPGASSAQGPLIGVLETMRKRGHRAHGRFLSCKIQPAPAEVAHELQLAQGVPVGAVSVMRYKDDVPFVISTTWCNPDVAKRLAEQDLAELDVVVAFEERLLLRIERTNIRVEATLADARLAKRLQCSSGSSILRVRATTMGYDGAPLAYSISESRGEMMDFRAVLRR
ncbi:MAG TPA: GntR family transcriptional regulator [Ramlibacter sp.]|nr:GntR family transcriptional regulator [Ramlibacter sp.]